MIEYIDGTRVANAVRMKRMHKSGKTFLLVEGVTDKRFYQKFTDDIKCDVEVAQNKDNVMEAIKILNKSKTKGVLGIVDSDFSALGKSSINEDNLFTTDTHDIETMIVKSPSLKNVLAEYGSRERLEEFRQKAGKRIREALKDSAMVIGYLRWYSLKNNLYLNFNELDFTKFIDRRTLQVHREELINEVIKNSSRYVRGGADISEEIAKLEAQMDDPWQVCCGHDIAEILAIGLGYIFGTEHSKNIKSYRVEEALRLSYSSLCFEETDLFKKLSQWEINNTPYKVLMEDSELETAI